MFLKKKSKKKNGKNKQNRRRSCAHNTSTHAHTHARARARTHTHTHTHTQEKVKNMKETKRTVQDNYSNDSINEIKPPPKCIRADYIVPSGCMGISAFGFA